MFPGIKQKDGPIQLGFRAEDASIVENGGEIHAASLCNGITWRCNNDNSSRK